MFITLAKLFLSSHEFGPDSDVKSVTGINVDLVFKVISLHRAFYCGFIISLIWVQQQNFLFVLLGRI